MKFDADKVRSLIEEAGYTVTGFCRDELGWNESMLRVLMRRGSCSPATLDELAYMLHVPVTELLPDELASIRVMLDEGAKMPTRAHDTDAGLDLYSPVDVVIPGYGEWYNCFKEINTGVHIQIPVGYVGDVKSKSGLMMQYHITTDGTVDAGYTGSIRVKLFNHGLSDVRIQKGQKIAQLVIKKIITPTPVLVDSLEDTERGANGFGSSGKF